MDLQTIKFYCEQKGISIKQLATEAGMSEPNLHRCIRMNKIQASDLESIAKVLDINVGEFFGVQVDESNGTNIVGSPCFDAVTLQGGAGRGTGMEALTPDMAVGRMLLPGLPTGSDIPYIQVRGESMVNHRDPSRSIPEGAWVGVKATQSCAIRWGEVYAVMTTDGPIVKKLMPSESEGCIRCVSFNEEGGYLPFDLPVGEIIAPLYKVVGVVSIKVL